MTKIASTLLAWALALMPAVHAAAAPTAQEEANRQTVLTFYEQGLNRKDAEAALQYLGNHHVALMRFLRSGAIPIDNGVVERLHVRTAMTRKAFLFAGSDAGAERAAVAYTLLGSCALAEVDPVEYLVDVLPRLTTTRVRMCDMAALLPAAWKAARDVRTDGAAYGVARHAPG